MHSPESGEMRPGRRLDSWKSIADYLGRDRTTVMRWERENGLPVRRVPGSSRSVFAYTTDIDAWLAAHGSDAPSAGAPTLPAASRAAPSGWRREGRRAAAVVGLLVVIAAGVAVAVSRTSAAVASVGVDGRAMVAFDAGGRRLWEHTVSTTSTSEVVSAHAVTDVNGDGRQDVFVALQHISGRGEGNGEAIRFDAGGRIVWRQALGDRYTFDGTEYAPGWYPNDLLVYRAGGAPRIAVAFHHHTWWPSVVVTLDEHGAVVGRFVNEGWIHSLNVTKDGRKLLASGVSNALGGVVLAVLDAARPTGTAPSRDGTPVACGGCPSGAALAYVVVPWSDVARRANPPPAMVHVTSTGAIELRAQQRRTPEMPTAELIVVLSPSLEVQQRRASDGFADLHAQLEQTGEVTHPLSACPWRTPPVRMWTPASGWRDVQ